MEEFKNMKELVDNFFGKAPFSVAPAYCDYIATICRTSLKAFDPEHLLSNVSNPELDMSEEGYFLSTKKTIHITDVNGRKYKLTVEEA